MPEFYPTPTQTKTSAVSDSWGGTSDGETESSTVGEHQADSPSQLLELPQPSAMALAQFTWGPNEVSSEQFIQSVNATYSEEVHWRRNIFFMPSGKAGKTFIRELAWLLRAYAAGSALFFKAAMILPPLLLQKPTLNPGPVIIPCV